MIRDFRGLAIKPAVAATIERIYSKSGNKFMCGFDVLFSGETAGIRVAVSGKVHIVMPTIDETAICSPELFSDLIAYSIHELGHLWHSDMGPWDEAVKQHGNFVGSLINGLEDPRIEKEVIKSNVAPASGELFEKLLNRVLSKNGYVQPDDFKNIPFMLAVEGRRLNGYKVCAKSVLDDSPFKDDLSWALKESSLAGRTSDIIDISVELNKRLSKFKQDEKEKKKKKSKNSDKSDNSDQSDQSKENGDNKEQAAEQACEARRVELSELIEKECAGLRKHKLPQLGKFKTHKIEWS